MSIAADPNYRSVHIQWLNVDAVGDEKVQVLTRPTGGSWGVSMATAVSIGEQELDWDTALPLTTYDIALRLTRGGAPTTGYDGDPDFWSAPTAAQSKGSVLTGCAPITDLTGTFVNASTPVSLEWVCAQLGVTFKMEKSTNGGATWTVLATGMTGRSYAYTVPVGEVGTTVMFRVTAMNGATAGPYLIAWIAMQITIGATVLTAGAFDPATGRVGLSWTQPTNAQYVRIEANYGGTGWGTIGTFVPPGTLSYTVSVPTQYINTVVQYRASGQNGSIVGPYSNVANVDCAISLGAPVLSASYNTPYAGMTRLTWSAVAAPASSYALYLSTDGINFTMYGNTGGSLQYDISSATAWTHAKVAAVTNYGYTGPFSNTVVLFP